LPYAHLPEWIAGKMPLAPQILLIGDSKGKAIFRPSVFVFRYEGKREVDADIAVLLIYEGLFYWYPLPRKNETAFRGFIEPGLAHLADLSWKPVLINEASVVEAGEIEISITHIGKPLVEEL
jgi:hypothetical protein